MKHLPRALSALLITGALLMPMSAFALGTAGVSFGGRIVSLFFCLNGAIYTHIVSAQTVTYGSIIPYIWTPATITKLAGPPSHVGQQIIGLSGPAPVPLCVVSWVPFFAIPGIPMLYEIGTSAL